MADLDTIIDTTEHKTSNSNTHSHHNSDTNVKSPSRKENILPPPPLPPIPTISINNNNLLPFHRSFNGGLSIKITAKNLITYFSFSSS
jgi:hypothetical protein